MRRLFTSFSLAIVLSLSFFLKPAPVTAQIALNRAYFRLKAPEALSQLQPYLHHDFGDNIFSIQAPQFIIDRLADNPLLEFRGPASRWYLTRRVTRTSTCAPANPYPWGITKVNGGSGGTGIKVAVLDTGVKTDHPDLKANIIDCRDAQYSSLRNRCADTNGHGTHVTGTIAASGKIKGVAPDAKIMAIKVCGGSYCWSDDVARGIRYAADKGANVINLSLGGSALAQDEKLALDYAADKGVLIVAAAGNSGPADNTINYPAAYSKVVAVGALGPTDALTSWSSRGNNYATTPYSVEERDIELAAPGLNVESTWKDGCYKTISGTSMATPHVAGLAAKLWQGTAAATRTYLQDRAQNFYADLGRPGDDPDAGFGLPTAP